MPLFALDQNFPEPIIGALNDFIPEAELVPLRQIDPILSEIDDWEVLLSLRHHKRRWDGLITNDGRMVNLPREMAVLRQTNLTLVIAHDAGHDPIRATGLLFTHLVWICRKPRPTRRRSGSCVHGTVRRTIRGITWSGLPSTETPMPRRSGDNRG